MNRYTLTILTILLTVNGWSFHPFYRSEPLNEANNIIGIEYVTPDERSMGCSYYTNSQFKSSTACGVSLRNENFSVTAGVVSGYSEDPLLYVLPFYRFEHDNIQVEVGGLPNVMVVLMKVSLF